MGFSMEGWLVLDGYEDEPAAFGVPNYVGFHIRYICGVFESRGIPYTYMTIDQWRINNKNKLSSLDTRTKLKNELSDLAGAVVLAGSIVPGKYVRGTPIRSGISYTSPSSSSLAAVLTVRVVYFGKRSSLLVKVLMEPRPSG